MEYVAQMEKLRECGKFFMSFRRHYPGEKVLEGQNGYSVPVRKWYPISISTIWTGISLGDAADNAGMNSSHLSTLFKNEVGNGLRGISERGHGLERAKELMDSSQLRLKGNH